MFEFDVLTIPQCLAATVAKKCSHSDLKNVFAVFPDDALADWIMDDGEFHRFENDARRLCDGMWGFSPADLVKRLRPLEELTPDQREALCRVLRLAFESGFRPEEQRARLITKLDALLEALNMFRGRVQKSTNLGKIRDLAMRLREEIDRLPDGFWLPRVPSFGVEQRRP